MLIFISRGYSQSNLVWHSHNSKSQIIAVYYGHRTESLPLFSKARHCSYKNCRKLQDHA